MYKHTHALTLKPWRAKIHIIVVGRGNGWWHHHRRSSLNFTCLYELSFELFEHFRLMMWPAHDSTYQWYIELLYLTAFTRCQTPNSWLLTRRCIALSFLPISMLVSDTDTLHSSILHTRTQIKNTHIPIRFFTDTVSDAYIQKYFVHVYIFWAFVKRIQVSEQNFTFASSLCQNLPYL